MRPVRLFLLLLSTLAAAPTLAAAQAPATATVPVAARDLPRGTVLTAADISFTGGDSVGADRVGWVTRRVIAAGEPLREPAISRPELVRAGQTVDLVWTQGRIEVRARGTAVRAGSLGDRIMVRIDTQRRLEGVIAGPGLVRLNSSDRNPS